MALFPRHEVFDDRFPTSQQYSHVRHFDVQDHLVPLEHLQGVGEILCRHGLQSLFGVSLLHRHDDLQEGSAMVHSRPDSHTDICQMVPVGGETALSRHSPCLYHLNQKRQWQSLEFDRRSERDVDLAIPGDGFWRQTRSFLEAHQLENVLAVSRLSPDGQFWIEALLENGTGTISRRVPRDQYVHTGSGRVVTEWAFHKEEGIIKLTATKVCRKPAEGGGHIQVKK